MKRNESKGRPMAWQHRVHKPGTSRSLGGIERKTGRQWASISRNGQNQQNQKHWNPWKSTLGRANRMHLSNQWGKNSKTSEKIAEVQVKGAEATINCHSDSAS